MRPTDFRPSRHEADLSRAQQCNQAGFREIRARMPATSALMAYRYRRVVIKRRLEDFTDQLLSQQRRIILQPLQHDSLIGITRKHHLSLSATRWWLCWKPTTGSRYPTQDFRECGGLHVELYMRNTIGISSMVFRMRDLQIELYMQNAMRFSFDGFPTCGSTHVDPTRITWWFSNPLRHNAEVKLYLRINENIS